MKTYYYKYQEGNVTVSGVVRAADSQQAIEDLANVLSGDYPKGFQLTEKATTDEGSRDSWDACDTMLALLIVTAVALFMMYIHYLITGPLPS